MRQIEGIRSVSVSRVVRRLPARGPLAFGRGARDHADVDEMAFEGGSAFLLGVGARSVFCASRVDQLVHRNRAAVRRARGDLPMGAAMGREADALSVLRRRWRRRRTGSTSTRRCAGWSACTIESRAGGRRCVRSTSRCAWARSRTSSFAPAPLASFERPDGRRRACRCGCSACSGRTGRCRFTSPSTRGAAAARGRPDAQPLPRPLPSSLHRAVLPGLGAGAADVNRDRAGDDRFARVRRRVPRAWRRRRCAIATPCRIWRSCSTWAR